MKNRNGVSLIELSIVLAAMVIIASFAIARISIFNTLFAKAEVYKMHAFFMHMQQKAIAHQQEQVVLIDQLKQEYSSTHYNERMPPSLRFGILPDIFGPPSQPTARVKQPVTFAHNRITFYPTGAISPGTVYVTDKTKTYQYALTCPVAANSSIHIYRYDHRWKQLV